MKSGPHPRVDTRTDFNTHALPYTSHVGLLEELGYSGNKYLPGFPQCTVPEH